MGFGLGELVGLRVEDLKLDHGVIEVAALSGTASKVKRRPRAGSGTSSLIPLPFNCSVTCLVAVNPAGSFNQEWHPARKP
jgi:hypothetical protein